MADNDRNDGDSRGQGRGTRTVSPASVLPSAGLYLGSLAVLVVATVIGVYLVISPPEETTRADVPGDETQFPTGEATATPTPTRSASDATATASAAITEAPASVTPTVPAGTTATETPAPDGTTVYTVLPGDTLFAIAAEYETTVDEIVALNPGLDPESLFPGDELLIPVP